MELIRLSIISNIQRIYSAHVYLARDSGTLNLQSENVYMALWSCIVGPSLTGRHELRVILLKLLHGLCHSFYGVYSDLTCGATF